MEWWIPLALAIGLLLALFMFGVPVFLAFLIINVGAFSFLIGPRSFGMIANSIFDVTTTGTFAAIPLFILMGEVLFRSGSTTVLFDAVDRVVGAIKGRQYVLATVLATVFGALAGSNMAVSAMMARTIYPGMIARGYDPKMSMGVIMAGASLAPIIPPSVLAIIIATMANISVAGLLIAGVGPGLMLSAMFVGYCLIRVKLNPGLAPTLSEEERTAQTHSESLIWVLLKCAPFLLIMFFVMGFILLGVATPTEAAAWGVIGAVGTAALLKRLNTNMLLVSLKSTAFVSSMIMVIIASSTMFSQFLAFTGASGQITQMVVALDYHPGIMLLIMMALVFAFCMFMDQVALMLVIIPIYSPIVTALGFDPLWFWLIMLLNITVGGITPPFGYVMFAFKGAAPSVRMQDLFVACWPFVGIFILACYIIYLFPPIATWLPQVF